MRILLATDGSRYAQTAAHRCAELAVGFGDEAAVKIITVVDNFTPMATEPFISPEEFLESVEREMQEEAEKIIGAAEKIIRSIAAEARVEREILIGSAKRIIVRAAEKWRADLVAVGSHGYGFWGRALLGSVSNAVVHHAPCSVLVAGMDRSSGGNGRPANGRTDL